MCGCIPTDPITSWIEFIDQKGINISKAQEKKIEGLISRKTLHGANHEIGNGIPFK